MIGLQRNGLLTVSQEVFQINGRVTLSWLAELAKIDLV